MTKLLFKNGKFYKPVIDSYSDCICDKCALDGELCISEETGVPECNVYASPDVCFIEDQTLTTKDIKDACYHFLPSIAHINLGEMNMSVPELLNKAAIQAFLIGDTKSTEAEIIKYAILKLKKEGSL